MKTYMEIRINSEEDATVLLIVTCADEVLTCQEQYTGTAKQCAEYTNYYFENGMSFDIVYQSGMSPYNQD